MNEEFELLDASDHKTKVSKVQVEVPLKQLMLFESPQILQMKEEIKQLRSEIRTVHYVNTLSRVAWIVFNPASHAQNVTRDYLFKFAGFVYRNWF